MLVKAITVDGRLHWYISKGNCLPPVIYTLQPMYSCFRVFSLLKLLKPCCNIQSLGYFNFILTLSQAQLTQNFQLALVKRLNFNYFAVHAVTLVALQSFLLVVVAAAVLQWNCKTHPKSMSILHMKAVRIWQVMQWKWCNTIVIISLESLH